MSISKEYNPHIHVDSFSPTITPSVAKLVVDVFGHTGWRDLKNILRSSGLDPNQNSISSLAYPQPEFLESIYKPETATIPQSESDIDVINAIYGRFGEDYRKVLSDANKAIDAVIDGLELPTNLCGQKQEIASTSEVMSHNMTKMYSQRYSDTVRYEMMRNHLLALPAMELYISKRVEKSQTKVSEFVDWLDEEVFSTSGQKLGETENKWVYSLHDRSTLWNSGAISTTGSFDGYHRGNTIQKAEELKVRRCVLDGKPYLIYFNQRLKDDGNAILKAVKKANGRKKVHMERIGQSNEYLFEKVDKKTQQRESDEITADDINDRIGAKLVVVEGDRDEFVKSLEKLMSKKYGEVIDDSQTNVDTEGVLLNGVQSQRHVFTRKKLPQYHNFEVIIYSLQEFLNSEYDLGGAAHTKYALERLVEIAKILFPKTLYPDLDIDEYYGRKLRKIENELREKNTI